MSLFFMKPYVFSCVKITAKGSSNGHLWFYTALENAMCYCITGLMFANNGPHYTYEQCFSALIAFNYIISGRLYSWLLSNLLFFQK